MLRDSLAGGIPPPMVPLIFAGIGGGNLPSHTLEWAQQYLASLSIQNQQQQHQIQAQHQQIQQQQQQQQAPPPQISPDMRRDNRMIPPNPYGGGGPPPSQAHQPPPPPAQPARPLGNSTNASQSSTSLSRLNTTDFVPSSNSQRPPLHPLSQQQTASAEQGSGNALFFHHWTPPNPGSGGNQPPTPSGKSQQGSPFGQATQSHLRVDYQNSPKKRKAVGGHPAPPIPTSAPGDGPSPSYSGPPSREGEVDGEQSQHRYSRQHSHTSSQGEPRNIARPSSRQQRQDELSAGASGSRRQFTSRSTSGSSEDRYEGIASETR